MNDHPTPLTVNELIAALTDLGNQGAGDELVEGRCSLGNGVSLVGSVTKVEDRGGVVLFVEGEDQ
jgi:hypothetical protein